MNKKLATTLTVLILAILAIIGGCSYSNVEDIKAHSTETWNNSGYDVIGYEGYQIGDFLGSPGGKVWYIVKRHGRDDVTYHGFLAKWGKEYHIYDLRAIDAIKPN